MTASEASCFRPTMTTAQRNQFRRFPSSACQLVSVDFVEFCVEKSSGVLTQLFVLDVLVLRVQLAYAEAS